MKIISFAILLFSTLAVGTNGIAHGHAKMGTAHSNAVHQEDGGGGRPYYHPNATIQAMMNLPDPVCLDGTKLTSLEHICPMPFLKGTVDEFRTFKWYHPTERSLLSLTFNTVKGDLIGFERHHGRYYGEPQSTKSGEQIFEYLMDFEDGIRNFQKFLASYLDPYRTKPLATLA